MTQAIVIITIDTEGDNVWAQPKRVTTRNALYLRRFQDLCEEHKFRPTYLVNYEMALDTVFQQFGYSVLQHNAAEIGLHVHPWNSPPFEKIPESQDVQMYLYELPEEVLYSKLEFLTRLLTEIFGIKPLCHRAGRWGFNEQVAHILSELGYRVDCSVTPGVCWTKYKGDPAGCGGPDYFGFPVHPYFLDANDIRFSGESDILEVPMTIKPNYREQLMRFHHKDASGVIERVLAHLMGQPFSWLRPNGDNLRSMLDIVDWVVTEKLPVLEFMLHSSELMPGGSPTFPKEEDIDRLYSHLETLFSYIGACGFRGMTLGEYRAARNRYLSVENV